MSRSSRSCFGSGLISDRSRRGPRGPVEIELAPTDFAASRYFYVTNPPTHIRDVVTRRYATYSNQVTRVNPTTTSPSRTIMIT